MHRRNWNKVFVTGGTGFIGLHTVSALVEAGAEVTVLVRPDHEEKLGALRRHVHTVPGDVWNSASLKGRSRGHGVVVHLVGSIRAQPQHGLTFHQLNLVSARNAISMAVSDGVPYFVLLSAAASRSVCQPVPAQQARSGRIPRDSGLRWTIGRAADLRPLGAQRAFLRFCRGRGTAAAESARRRRAAARRCRRAGDCQAALQPDVLRDQRLYASDRNLGEGAAAGRIAAAQRASRRLRTRYSTTKCRSAGCLADSTTTSEVSEDFSLKRIY